MVIATTPNWTLFQLDVNISFLHGDMNEEVYIHPPHGLDLPHSDMVCKLQISLYGIRQARNGTQNSLKLFFIPDTLSQSLTTPCSLSIMVHILL